MMAKDKKNRNNQSSNQQQGSQQSNQNKSTSIPESQESGSHPNDRRAK